MARSRINCFSRRARARARAAAADDGPLAPARPIFQLPLRPRHPRDEPIRPVRQPDNPPQVHHQVPLDQQPLLEAARIAMNNAARQRAEGGNRPPQNYVDLISDDEDDFMDLHPPAHRNPAPQHNHAPPAAPIQDGALNDAGQAQPAVDFAAFINEDEDGMDVNDPLLARFMMEAFEREHNEAAARVVEPARRPSPAQPDPQNIPGLRPLPVVDPRIQCIDQVMLVFPDVCRDYVSELYATVSQSADTLIAHVLDKVERGTQYPKAKDTQKKLKRKRVLDEDEEAARKYGSADRVMAAGAGGLRPFIRTLLSKDFPDTPMNFIDIALNSSGHRLFSTYRVLEEAHRTYDENRPPYNKIKTARKMEIQYKEANMEATIESIARIQGMDAEVEILKELQAARRIRKKAEAKREEELLAKIEEQKNVRKAQQEGTMAECGCCYDDFPLNRMVHCNSDNIHFFCRACAKQNANTEIGNSKYELRCMSMDDCSAGFSLDQRNQFLDESTIIALERNEQEAVLRMAGIENLASCPFCPFAAEYPPIEIDREFRCQAPDCEKTSCRLCKLESHIPKSCEEHAKDQGLSVRRLIEEAMSAALIRKCNKCGTPFVKEEGCNKMTCTRNGCMNVQCYICSKSCQYDHFDDTRRGGKTGNCPLFESVEARHDTEVKKAEQEALEKVRLEHPEYTEEDLKVKMSENVKIDDERRKADPRNRNIAAGVGGVHALHRQIPPRFMEFLVPMEHRELGAGGLAADPALAGPRRPMPYPPMPPYGQDIFADINFDGDEDADIFAGMWDNLPGLRLEAGQIEDQPGVPQLGPPQAPRMGRRALPLNPAPMAQAVPIAPQYGNAEAHRPAFFAADALPFGWNGQQAQAGGHVIPAIPHRRPRAATPAALQPPPAVFKRDPRLEARLNAMKALDQRRNAIKALDQRRNSLHIQNRLGELLHLADRIDVELPPKRPSAPNLMQEAQVPQPPAVARPWDAPFDPSPAGAAHRARPKWNIKHPGREYNPPGGHT